MNNEIKDALRYELKEIPTIDGYVISRCGEFVGCCRPRNRNAKTPEFPRKLKTHINKEGYKKISIRKQNGKNSSHFIHHLVAITFIGRRPDGMQVNHINGKKGDNRVENLEYVSPRENTTHAAKNNMSGYTGVYKNGSGWQASIRINGKYKALGTFKTPQQAHEAYLLELKKNKIKNKYAKGGD